jgi:hypothetical protein
MGKVDTGGVIGATVVAWVKVAKVASMQPEVTWSHFLK